MPSPPFVSMSSRPCDAVATKTKSRAAARVVRNELAKINARRSGQQREAERMGQAAVPEDVGVADAEVEPHDIEIGNHRRNDAGAKQSRRYARCANCQAERKRNGGVRQ